MFFFLFSYLASNYYILQTLCLITSSYSRISPKYKESKSEFGFSLIARATKTEIAETLFSRLIMETMTLNDADLNDQLWIPKNDLFVYVFSSYHLF